MSEESDKRPNPWKEDGLLKVMLQRREKKEYDVDSIKVVGSFLASRQSLITLKMTLQLSRRSLRSKAMQGGRRSTARMWSRRVDEGPHLQRDIGGKRLMKGRIPRQF